MDDGDRELTRQELLGRAVEDAENELYIHFDQCGANKKSTYPIGIFIDAKIDAALNRFIEAYGLTLPTQKESRE